MARAYGSSATLLLKRETAYGQVAGGDYIRMPFNRCTLGSEQGLIDDPVLGQGRDPLAPLQDVINDEGEIVVPMDPRYLGIWLTGLFGDPVTTDNGDGTFDHLFVSGNDTLPSYTVEVGMPQVPAFFQHTGVVLGSIALEFQRSGAAAATLGVIAQGETRNNTSQGGTPSALAFTRISQFQGSITRAGSPIGNLTGGSLTYSNNLEKIETIRSDGKIDGADPTVAALTGRIDVRFADTTLIDRSISAADAVAKTADKLGVGVEALQELRFAAQLAGVEQQTLDMGLQRFTRRVAEAARGTGEAKQALTDMGIVLRDQHGNIRRSEDLLNDVAEAFKRTGDPAERLRLAFKLFDSEGVAMVNMLVGGADALEATRRHARDLGIVLEEDLVRNAEKARDQLDTLGKVVSANLTRAMLDLAPAIAEISSGLADLAADAATAYEQIKLVLSGDFNFEGLSERSTRRIVEERRQELQDIARELQEIGDVGFLDDPIAWGRKVALERRLQERVEQYRQWATKLAWMQRGDNADASTAPDGGTTPDAIEADIRAAQDRSRRITQIENDLQRQLFEATHEGADRIRAEYQQLVAEMQTLIEPDGGNLDQVGEIMARAAALRDARLARLAAQEDEAARRRQEANTRIIEGLRAERDELAMTDKQRFVSQALRRLSAEATDA